MAENFEDAGLTVVLAGSFHSTAEVSLLLENMQMLVSASIWAAITNPETKDEALATARQVLLHSLAENEAAGARFYPVFYQALQKPGALPFESSFIETEDSSSRRRPVPNDPASTFDVATSVGVNSWMQRELLRESPDLHRRLFDFASIRRVEHNSPLLLELGIVLGTFAALPVVLTYGLMRAAAKAKRFNIETDIREVELADKKIALKQREVQLIIQEEVAEAIREQRKRNSNYQVPESVLANVVQFSTPAIADLGSNPFIEKVSFSASIGGKG